MFPFSAFWRFCSSSLDSFSASATIFWISLSLSPLEASILIFCSLPVALSCAETRTMPLASRSNVTSI